MTKRMLIMLGAIVVLVAALAFGFYLHIQKLMASSPKPGPQTVTATQVQALTTHTTPLVAAVTANTPAAPTS